MDNFFKNEIPEWDFFKHFSQTDEGELSQKQNRLKSAETLYNQSREIYQLAKLFCETLTGEYAAHTTNLVMENAGAVPVKIIGAEAGDLYVLRMENAAIIRLNYRQLLEQIGFSRVINIGKDEYSELLLAEIEKFRKLFTEWVDSFETDKITDDWGVF